MKRFVAVLLLVSSIAIALPLKKPLMVTATLEHLQLLNRLLKDKDFDAAQKMNDDRLTMLIFSGKDVVISEDKGEYVKVRIKGEYVEFWANKDDYKRSTTEP
jgi:hypothetical protein